MSLVVKTIFLSLASRTGLQNSTAPPTSSLGSSLASNAITPSGSVRLNATASAATNPALACIRSSSDYESAMSSYHRDTANYEQVTTTTEYDYTESRLSYSCTSSCGSSPGAISYCGSAELVNTTSHVSRTGVTNIFTVPPPPEPTCTVANSDCASLITSYSSALDEFQSDTTAISSPQSPDCCVSTACTFSYDAMDFYFYPVTNNISRNMCANTPFGGYENSVTKTGDPDTTYTEVTTGSSTVVNGVTMYEGNVYMSMKDPYVYDNCRKRILPKYQKPQIVAMASSDVYSVIAYPHNMIAYSLRYEDFNDPIPWSAYMGQSGCWNNHVGCTEVIPGHYQPAILMPGQIRQLDPNWASCSYDKYALFDPPIALKGVPNFLTSSPPTDPTTTSPEPIVSATPGQSSNDDIPPNTSAPQPTRSASNPQDPASSPRPQDPTRTRIPSEPQVSDPSTPQDPSPNDPQDPSPNNPQDPSPNNPSPNNPQDPSPADPQNPSPDDPTNPAPGNTQPPSPNNPQNPGTGPDSVTNPAANPTRQGITVGSNVIPVNPTGGLIVNPGMTLTSGGAPVITGSSTFSIGTGGLTIITPETSTEIPLGNEPITVPIGPSGAPIVIGPSASSVVLSGTTLTPGAAPVVIDGTTLSMGSSGVVVVGDEGTSTIAIPTGVAAPTAVTVGDEVFTITSGSVVFGPGTTLTPGDPAVTIDGTVYSVGSTGVVVVVDGQTSTVPVTLDPSSDGEATSTGAGPSETGAEEFPGAAGRIGWNKALVVGLVGVWYVMIC
ncbi:hypothetical protein PMIN06_009606 [Paraphaeosphaeria minitans]